MEIAVCASIYGFTVGCVGSLRVACWNLLKFPLLIFGTGLLCGLAYYMFSQLITRKLSLRLVARLSLDVYHDLAVLLASLAPVALFLALTLRQPGSADLGEYPWFLGLNVLAIALCGQLSLIARTLWLVRSVGLSWRRSVAVLVVWLAVSLAVGGQAAWFLRPFFGISTVEASIEDFPVFEGRRPDFRGATSFYEAVYNLFDPPPLKRGYGEYWQRRKRAR